MSRVILSVSRIGIASLKQSSRTYASNTGAPKLVPLFDRVLVERFAKETTTKGGIMLPEKATGKVLNATVLAVGPGNRRDNGEFAGCSVKAGDRVLLPEYGGTKVEIDNREYYLFRDSDILGKWSE